MQFRKLMICCYKQFQWCVCVCVFVCMNSCYLVTLLPSPSWYSHSLLYSQSPANADVVIISIQHIVCYRKSLGASKRMKKKEEHTPFFLYCFNITRFSCKSNKIKWIIYYRIKYSGVSILCVIGKRINWIYFCCGHAKESIQRFR